MPQQYSSFDFRMDGSRFIPDIGVPSSSTSLTLPSTLPKSARGRDSMFYDILTTTPTPLPGGSKYSFVAADGMGEVTALIAGNDTASEILTTIPNGGSVIQLLTDSASIYSVHLIGKVNCFDHAGKVQWSTVIQGFPKANSIIAENALIITSDSAITAIDIHSGKNIWIYRTTMSIGGTIYDGRSKLIIASLSFNNPDAGDSIICFTSTGEIKSHIAFQSTRIISNLCLCGNKKEKIAFGYFGKPDAVNNQRTMHVAVYSGVQTGNPKSMSDHEVPYLVTNLASNGQILLSSGFRETGSDLQSGIDAFNADDTTKIWQRRFSYPVVLPPAINERYLYFSLTFISEAEVTTQSIFYTLDLTNGKTLVELPVAGAKDGFVNGIPMPMNGAALMLADRSRPVIYFLKP